MFDLLTGATVVEFSHMWPDSVGQYLADLGADVIKVEHPVHGSATRSIHVYDSLPMAHISWNRGKKSIAIDVKSNEGRELVLRLLATADIQIEGMRAGALDRLGIGYEAVRELNPAIVYLAISGWGQDGPYRYLATHGAGFDAFAGLQPPARGPDGVPELPEVPGTRGESHYGVLISGLYAAMAAAAAYSRRLSTGTGAYLDIAQADGAVACMFDHLFYRLNGIDVSTKTMKPVQPPAARTRYQYYAASDGTVFFSPTSEDQWERFSQAVDRPDLAHSIADTPEERALLNEILARRTTAEWLTLSLEHDIGFAPVNSVDELLDDPQFIARDLVAAYEDPDRGRVNVLGFPGKVAGQDFETRRPPALGEHTHEILQRLGLSSRQAADLAARGVVN